MIDGDFMNESIYLLQIQLINYEWMELITLSPTWTENLFTRAPTHIVLQSCCAILNQCMIITQLDESDYHFASEEIDGAPADTWELVYSLIDNLWMKWVFSTSGYMKNKKTGTYNCGPIPWVPIFPDIRNWG